MYLTLGDMNRTAESHSAYPSTAFGLIVVEAILCVSTAAGPAWGQWAELHAVGSTDSLWVLYEAQGQETHDDSHKECQIHRGEEAQDRITLMSGLELRLPTDLHGLRVLLINPLDKHLHLFRGLST